MDYRVISIGALSRHELWNEQAELRTGHATTSLVRSAGKVILVDPGLPAQIIAARFSERTGLQPSAVTDVFLTNFRPAHRRGLLAFPNARWLISDAEREFVGVRLIEMHRRSQEPAEKKILEEDIAILKRCEPAPDKIVAQVDLFPLPGYTPGTCGLLLSLATSTALIAGDAVATVEHLEQGRVLRGCQDTEKAQESFVEAIEIADVIIPGHDNLIVNPTRKPI